MVFPSLCIGSYRSVDGRAAFAVGDRSALVTSEPLTVAAPLPRDLLEEAHGRALVIGHEQETRAQMS
jgi:hypothetical protein